MGDSAFKTIYDTIAKRKGESQSSHEYHGGNGRIDRAVELIRTWKLPSDAALLDIGGATGNLGYALRDLFDERYVMDIAEDCRVPAEAKGNMFSCGNVDEIGLSHFPSECLDVITMLDVIEHVIDPGGLARECLRVLRPGGWVLVNTPNIQYWRHLHSLVVMGKFPHTSGDSEVYHGGHVAFYNWWDMISIFGSAGFIEFESHFDGLLADPPPPIWVSIAEIPSARQMSYADLVISCRKH